MAILTGQLSREAGQNRFGRPDYPHNLLKKVTVMKKLFSLLIVAVALCGFTIGCSSDDSAPATTDTPAAGATDDADAAADDTAEEDGSATAE